MKRKEFQTHLYIFEDLKKFVKFMEGFILQGTTHGPEFMVLLHHSGRDWWIIKTTPSSGLQRKSAEFWNKEKIWLSGKGS